MSSQNRQAVPQKSLERQWSKGDDPWCLTCGVNLTLDGRTYTKVFRRNHADLCDIFSRVLGAEFSPDYASVNVCNRCERHLRRLGRYSSIILARHEGEKLREQLEKNLAKHGQKVIDSGLVENLPSPISPKPFKSENLSKTSGTRKSISFDSHSSIKRVGHNTNRSVSSVHFKDEDNSGRKAIRKLSAPEGLVRKRESLSPFSEGERRREARRRKWSSASSTSEDSTPASQTISTDRPQGGRGVSLSSLQDNDDNQSTMETFSTELPQNPDQLSINNFSVHQDQAERAEEPTQSDFTVNNEAMSLTDQQIIAVTNGDLDVSLQRMNTITADDEIFTKISPDLLKDSPQDRESPVEVDPSDFNADARSNLSEVEDRITTKSKFKGAYYNIGSTEDLLQEFANEEVRERAAWSKLTFTESVDVGDSGDDPQIERPVRPPRRSKSGRSSSKRKGEDSEDIQEEGETNKVNGSEETTNEDKEVKANGAVPDQQKDSSVNLSPGEDDGSSAAKFTKGNSDSQVSQDGTTSIPKSEKSPLIGKDGSSNLKVRNGPEKKLKAQMPFLCCSVL